MTNPPPSDDPVRARRQRIAHLAELAQRLGYLLFAAAVVAFILAFVVGFSSGWVTFILTCMIVGSIVLAPAIVTGYAVKAAERDDLEHGR